VPSTSSNGSILSLETDRDSSTNLDFSIRQQILDLCRVVYEEKTSYMVVLQLPKQRKRLVCHNLGKVTTLPPWKLVLMERVKSSCGMSFREMRLRSGLAR